MGEVVVTGSRIARRDLAPAPGFMAQKSDAAAQSPETRAGEVVVTGVRIGRRDLAQAARLRAAAADGRTGEVEALLAQGVPVDAPDRNGTTALMMSILADQPTSIVVLRLHGASVDRKDHAGRSAKDIAADQHDPEIDEAIALPIVEPPAATPPLGSR